MPEWVAWVVTLAAHTETREEATYDLVVARRDGRMGPQWKPSTLDCSRVDPLVPHTSAGRELSG